MPVEDGSLRSAFPCEAELRFPLEGGGGLTLRRGVIVCFVSFEGLVDSGSGWDWVATRVALADRDGRVLCQKRRIESNLFLELVRLGRPTTRVNLPALLSGVRCYHDGRTHIPTLGEDEEGVTSLAYWANDLQTTIDLLGVPSRGWEELVIAVPPTSGGGIGLRPTGRVSIATSWAAKLALWPSMFSAPGGALREDCSFRLTDERGVPQSLVTVE